MPDQNDGSVRFGDYVLDRADERLIGPHGPVRIGNKAFRVLEAMALTKGRLLTKDELFETVWTGTTVSESALTSVIKELRHALNDDRRAPVYITSVYGRGYRFLPIVEDVAGPSDRDIPLHPRAAMPAPPPHQHVVERRLITAMSIDFVDVAHAAAAIDPEILADVLTRHRGRVTRSVTAAGGRIVRSAGDCLLACFGWPGAREDAGECAIRAGLAIVGDAERVGDGDGDGARWRPRIGIATGVVVVEDEDDGARRDISLIGEAPNLAARLRHIAEPDTVAISAATHRHVGRLFDCTLLGERSADGTSSPVQAWRVVRPAIHLSRFHAVRTVGNSFVGRDHELSLLADRWRTAAEGNGRTVVILGEAGMGKSRLVDTLLNKIADQAHTAMVWQCSPDHQVKPLYPIVEHLTHAAGIAEADPPAEQLRRIAALLASVQMPLEQNVALFAHLLAIPPDAGFALPALPPNLMRAATIAALIEWLRRVASTKPTLVVIEDAHWIDPSTLELLTSLVGSLGDTAILALVTGRPEFASPWSGRAEVGTVGLDRLHDRECTTLAREIVGVAESHSHTVAEVVARSDGNPLYVEELSAAVLEMTAASATNVPDSLQSSLMARLDLLGEAKRLAQICSVLGRRFTLSLLTEVADLAPVQLDDGLALLVEHDVIRPIGGAGAGRYEFKHALLRDAAYESLLFSSRRRLHEACGRSLELSFADVARTQPELLAQHFRLAGLAEAAGRYSELAGDRATAACAFQEAIASYEEALRQNDTRAEGVDRDRRALALLLKLGPAVAMFRGAQGADVRDIYRRAETLSRRADDNDALFKSVWGLWYNANIARDLDDAGAFAQELVVIAEQSGDEDLALEASHCRWSSALFSADYRRCMADARHGAQLYDRHRHHALGLVFGGHDPGVCAFGCLGQAQVYAGDVADGLASVDTAVALAEELGHPGSLAHGLLMGLIVGTTVRRTALLQSYAERTLDLSQRFALPPQQAIGTYHLAWIEAEAGNRENGLHRMAALYDRVTAIGPITLLYKVMYVDQLLRAGRAELALAVADEAVARLRCSNRGLFLSEMLRLRGECMIALHRGNDGAAELVDAEAMARRDGSALFRLRAAIGLYKAVGPTARSTLAAAYAATPQDRHGEDRSDARRLLST